ncbi:MAG: ImmA/IrrE family metallo-endopeptidase [Chitinophagaceae bacterium]|nr:ImmA/IrrE family metallo-endopeptidase [Chitinophagaceae bacterium]
MNQSLEEIAELAEFIAEENIVRGYVNLKKIGQCNDIEIHYESFGDYFTGMLQHEEGMFDIFVNLDKVRSEKYPRARFTVAHELGHYFIDNHRNQLKKGYSLSYDKELTYFTNHQVEREANMFATNLLMPKDRFVAFASNYEIGIEAIKALSKQFKTSLTSTAIQYHNLVSSPCGLIFWDRNMLFKNKKYSNALYDLIKQFSTNFNVKESVKSEIFEDFNNDFFNVVETSSITSSLAHFYPDIQTKSKHDIPVTVETINLQAYGFISILYINQ